jgi:hypothetical protein
MTSDRPYRSALPVHTARSVVDAGRGELFDPEIVDAFFAVGEGAWKLISADPQTTSTHKIICGEWFDSDVSSGTHFPGPALGEGRQLR